MKIKVVVGDNSNRNFSKELELYVPASVMLVVEDSMNTCDPEEYDEAWNKLCAIVQRSSSLPCDWFIDKYEILV